MADALMGLQLGIEVGQGGLQLGADLSGRQQPRCRRQFNQRQRLIQVAAHQADLLHMAVLGDLTLNRRRRHVLALAGLEDVLHPAGDTQVAVAVQLPLVTGVQPAVLQGLGGFLRVQVVAQHQRRAAKQNFAILGNAHLKPRHRPTNRAKAHLSWPVEAAIGDVFAHPVAFAEGQADGLIPVEQPAGNRRCTRDHHARLIQPQAAADLACHQPAQQRNAQQPRQFGLGQLLQHALLKARPQPRHSEKHRGADVTQIAGKALQRLDKSHRRAAVQAVELDHKPLGHMGQRQKGKEPILRAHAQFRTSTGRSKSHRLHRQHHPLGVAGSA